MEQRLSFVTLAVRDVDRSRSFYVDALGWSPELDVPGEVLMFMAGEHLVLSLWDRAQFEVELGAPALDGDGLVPVTLSHTSPPGRGREVLDLATGAVRRSAGRGRAGVGRLHRLLRRPGRLPVGGRLEPGTDRAAGGARHRRRRPSVTAVSSRRRTRRLVLRGWRSNAGRSGSPPKRRARHCGCGSAS